MEKRFVHVVVGGDWDDMSFDEFAYLSEPRAQERANQLRQDPEWQGLTIDVQAFELVE